MSGKGVAGIGGGLGLVIPVTLPVTLLPTSIDMEIIIPLNNV